MLQDDRENIIRQQNLQKQENSQSLRVSNFNSNKDSVIGEQKKLTVLAESIFLRFLPIPFIKYLYEEGTDKFLEIYKMQSYESPILIWNQKMRLILEKSIIDHSADFKETLREFANKPDFELKQSEQIPVYNKKFKNIVKYPEIENEVRCGRYYLRVWVSQNKNDPNFFDIPKEEEEEFHKNLQIELRHCIYDENFEDKQKIIILFKACLLTLYKFKTKKTFSLDEIKRILIHTCKNKQVYDETIKQLVYIGIKIIFQVVKTESQQFITNSVKQNSDSLKEALTKIGVEIIGEIFTLILNNSFGSLSLEESDDFEKVLEKNMMSNNKIRLDRIEAKTLSLCIQSFNIILNTDILAFVDFPLQNRISLFKQVSRLVDVSFELIPLFKDKQLTNHMHVYESKIYNNSSFTQMQIHSPRNNIKGSKNKQTKRQKSKRKRSKSKAKNKHQQITQNQHTSWQLVNLTNNNQSNYNPQIGQMLAKPTQNQLIMELDKYNTGKQKKVRERKKIHKKDPTINYQNQSLLEIIKDCMDKHSIELIFDMSRSIFELTREITKNPVLHPELIASGMAWKALKYIYLQLKDQTSEFSDLRVSLREATATLKNLISFAHQLANFGAESFAFKNLTKDTEKEIMKNFWLCIKSIFGQKIQETLISQFIITNNELRFQDYEPRRFLQQFSVREENSPLLVWNDETRKELLGVIDKQINNLQESFYNELIQFDYSVNIRELRVEDIFVRHFNNQSLYKPVDIEGFSSKLIDKLRDIVELKYVGDLDEINHSNCIELVKALKILIINENLLIADQDKFDDYISTFCNLIQLRPDDEKERIIAQVNDEREMIKNVSCHVLEILVHISKTGGLHFDYLKSNNDFIRMLIRSLYQKESEVVESQTIIQILQNMLASREIDIDQFLIGTGLIMFILNQIFEKKSQNQNIRDRVELIRIILQAAPSTQSIYSKFIPFYFFVEIQQKQLNDPDTEKIIEFIKDFDAPEFENVFIIWNSQLKQESHARIKSNCEQIVRSYEDSNQLINLDLKSLENPKLDHEIIVSDVILRIYNMNPAVFINIKLNTFILHLSQEIWKVSQELFKIGQLQDNEEDVLRRGSAHSLQQNYLNSNPKFKILCNQSLILLTSLLLSLEQLLFNDYNSNRLMASKKEDKNAETKLYKQIIEKTTDQTQLDSKVYQIISFWLQTQVFLSLHIPVEIRLTFYQIVFLIIDVSDAMKVFKDNQSLMQFITDSINNTFQIANADSGRFDNKKIRKTPQKMLRKDSEPTPALITSSMQKFLKIFEREKKLRKLIEFILIIMGQDQQYRQSVLEQVKQYNNQNTQVKLSRLKSVQNKIDIKLIAEGRPENSETTEAILKIWRGKPASASDARRHYNILECYHIEDKLDETNIPKIKLPLLSKKSAKQFQKEDIFFNDLRLQSVADMPLSQRSTNQPIGVSSTKNLNSQRSERIASATNAKASNQNDALLMSSASKNQKLGYNPILENLDKTIGGFDVEAIPKQDQSFSDDDDDDNLTQN